MDFEFKYSEEKKMILGRVSGELELPVLTKMTLELKKLSEAHNCMKCLSDMRESPVPESIIDIFDVPKAVSKAGDMGNFKYAMIVKEVRDQWEFLETISVDRGQRVKIFTDFDEACAWLDDK